MVFLNVCSWNGRTSSLVLWLFGDTKEVHMKLVIPAILAAALVASPAAFAQNYQGTTSQPGASFQKDDTKTVPKSAKKHMASTTKHHSKRMKSSAQPGPANSSNPAASTTKEDVTPKPR
jgi:hypothetical protein